MDGDRGPRLAPATDSIQLVPMLRKWWWVLLAAFTGGVFMGVGLVSQSAPAYSTTVEILVGPVVADARTIEGSADLARTFGEVVESRRVRAEAVDGLEVDPDTVVVSAEAGRGSSTLTIDVQTPSGEFTPQIALGVVEALRSIVDEGRPSISDLGVLTPEDEAALDELLFPSGSEIVVIDDGGGVAADQSLGPEVGGVLGGLAVTLVVSAAVLALEMRRQHDPSIAIVEATLGADLGRLELAPLVSMLFRRHRGLTVAAHAIATRPTLGLDLGDAARDEATIVFVTTRADHRSYVEALLQLALVLDDPPLIIDPDNTIARHEANPLLRGVIYELRAQGALDAHLVVPRREWALLARTPQAVRQLCRSVQGDHSVVFVCVPAGDGHPNWRPWAAGADHALVLARPRDLQQHLRRVASQVRAVQPSMLGGVRINRPWLRGGAARRVGFEPRARVDAPADSDSGRSGSDRLVPPRMLPPAPK